MRAFRIRTDIERESVGEFRLPLGVHAAGLPRPAEGFVVNFREGEEEEPDTYVFEATISHDRLRPLLREALDLLPGEVRGILEIESLDAYRSLDVHLGVEPIDRDDFLADFAEFEPVILEDVSIGVGANADEPFVEVFLDAWKTLTIEVPIELKSRVEAMLERHGLSEVPETWPADPDGSLYAGATVRPVLLVEDSQDPNIDEVSLQLRERWALELDVDPQRNLDEQGVELGLTLWHAIVMVVAADPATESGAYVDVWATAGSLAEMEELIDEALDAQDEWIFDGIYSVERVAFDERPEELSDLPMRRTSSGIHLVTLDRWSDGDGGEPSSEREPPAR
ncbi:MAG: hypothetical protein ACO3EP_03570 [Phycisphaerales bacterium]